LADSLTLCGQQSVTSFSLGSLAACCQFDYMYMYWPGLTAAGQYNIEERPAASRWPLPPGHWRDLL